MPRPRRLHVTGGLYLVTLKGSAQQTIVADDRDRRELERLIELALKRSRGKAHAYCWLPDRLLLAIQISDTPLGHVVQRFASPYALHCQQRAGRAGHFFARRYHAALIEPGRLSSLVRHIHRAPIDAGLAAKADDYAWSSHHAYLGRSSVPWLTTRAVLRTFSSQRSDARHHYAGFIDADPPGEFSPALDLQPRDGHRIIGSDDFRLAVTQRTSAPLPFESLDQLIDSVCRTLRVRRDDVLSLARHRPYSRARAVIAWHATHTGLATLKQVAGVLERHPSTLSVAMDRYQSLQPALFKLSRIYHSPAPARHR